MVPLAMVMHSKRGKETAEVSSSSLGHRRPATAPTVVEGSMPSGSATPCSSPARSVAPSTVVAGTHRGRSPSVEMSDVFPQHRRSRSRSRQHWHAYSNTGGKGVSGGSDTGGGKNRAKAKAGAKGGNTPTPKAAKKLSLQEHLLKNAASGEGPLNETVEQNVLVAVHEKMKAESEETKRRLVGANGRGGGFLKSLNDVKLTAQEKKRVGEITPEILTLELQRLVKEHGDYNGILQKWEKGSLVAAKQAAELLLKGIDAFVVRYEKMQGVLAVIREVTKSNKNKEGQNHRNKVNRYTKDMKSGGWPAEVAKVAATSAVVAVGTKENYLGDQNLLTKTGVYAKDSKVGTHMQSLLDSATPEDVCAAEQSVRQAVLVEQKKPHGAKGSLHHVELKTPPTWASLDISLQDYDER